MSEPIVWVTHCKHDFIKKIIKDPKIIDDWYVKNGSLRRPKFLVAQRYSKCKQYKAG